MSTTPFRLCLVMAEVGATPIRAPLPSNTHGPASLRGVIGPSCPLVVGTPPLPGLGVLLVLGVAFGIATGSDAMWDAASVVEGVLAPSLLGMALFITMLSVEDDAEGPTTSPWLGVRGTADRDRSNEDLARSAADALARSSDVLILSTDVLPASTWAGGSKRGSLDLPSSDFSFSLSASSSFNSSQSSGSSTSASRSAAARQLGQMKIG